MTTAPTKKPKAKRAKSKQRNKRPRDGRPVGLVTSTVKPPTKGGRSERGLEKPDLERDPKSEPEPEPRLELEPEQATETKRETPTSSAANGKPADQTESALSLPHDLCGLEDEQVTEEARAGFRQIEEATRSMAEGARRVGVAFSEMKRRKHHGEYTMWLKDKFSKSEQTARLYVRIADNWDLIVGRGLEGASLRALNRFIAESKANGKDEKMKGQQAKTGDGEMVEGGAEDEQDDGVENEVIEDGDNEETTDEEEEALAPERRAFVLTFEDEDDKDEYEDTLDWLVRNCDLGDRPTAALQAALRWRREEEARLDKPDPTDELRP